MSYVPSVLERRIHAAALHAGQPDGANWPSLESSLNKYISQRGNVPLSFDIHLSICEAVASG
jgi:hypothetical protein